MRRRIIIDIQADGHAADRIITNIEATALGQFGAHADELDLFGVHKETLPEKISPQLQVPEFLLNRPFAEGKRGGM